MCNTRYLNCVVDVCNINIDLNSSHILTIHKGQEKDSLVLQIIQMTIRECDYYSVTHLSMFSKVTSYHPYLIMAVQ